MLIRTSRVNCLVRCLSYQEVARLHVYFASFQWDLYPLFIPYEGIRVLWLNVSWQSTAALMWHKSEETLRPLPTCSPWWPPEGAELIPSGTLFWCLKYFSPFSKAARKGYCDNSLMLQMVRCLLSNTKKSHLKQKKIWESLYKSALRGNGGQGNNQNW